MKLQLKWIVIIICIILSSIILKKILHNQFVNIKNQLILILIWIVLILYLYYYNVLLLLIILLYCIYKIAIKMIINNNMYCYFV